MIFWQKENGCPYSKKKKESLFFSLNWLLILPLKNSKKKKEEGKKERLKHPKLVSGLLFGALIPGR